jgi:gamma-tubulin complex component 3
MRNYMLLGQGDFVLHLLESLQQELDKPADELFRRNLAEHVETAISLTNAQFDHPDVLKAIDVRLHGMNPGDVGWDIFSLNYNVEGPLKTIFPTEVMKKYIR